MTATFKRRKTNPKPLLVRYQDQRSEPREFVICPIALSLESGAGHGIVRDISTTGIFFYSKFRPTLHSHISFTLRLKEKNIKGAGNVVRVQEGAPGVAIGVAVKISAWEDSPSAGFADCVDPIAANEANKMSSRVSSASGVR